MAQLNPKTHYLLLGAAGLHLLLAASLPLTLFEAHYGLYGVHLQWSYVDHPPLMGWLQALVQLFSHADVAQRLMPQLLSLATQYGLVLLALRLFPSQPRIDLFTAILLQLTPISHIGFAAAPDLPLALFSLLALWATLQVLNTNRWGPWIGLGLSLGLAGLSKYTAIALLPALALLLWQHCRWRWLGNVRFWAAAAVGALCITPVLAWNYNHQWISFLFQLSYQEGDGGWSLAGLLKAVAGQLGAYTPLALLAFLPVRDAGCKAIAVKLRIWALPLLLLFLIQAGSGRSAVHWTYSAWLLLSPVAAWQLAQFWPKRWLRFVTYSWGLLIGALLVLALLLPHLSYKDFKHPLAKISGWPAAAERAQQLRQQWAAEAGLNASSISVAVENWHHAEPLAWYLRPQPVRTRQPQLSQYSQWFGQLKPGDYALLVVPTKSSQPTPQSGCEWVDSLPVSINGKLAQVFHFYRCQ